MESFTVTTGDRHDEPKWMKLQSQDSVTGFPFKKIIFQDLSLYWLGCRYACHHYLASSRNSTGTTMEVHNYGVCFL